MTTLWSGQSFHLDDAFGTGITFEYGDVFVTGDATLLRTLIWVQVAAYAPYEQGDSGLTIVPASWAFGDLNSFHHTASSVGDVPGNAEEELIATDMLPLGWTGLGWPPNSSATLSGSINSIDSSGDLETTYNTNQFMYGFGRSYVDSNAQRLFNTVPVYMFTMHDWATSVAGGIRPAGEAWVMIRSLYRLF